MICPDLEDCAKEHAKMTTESVIDLAEGLDDSNLNGLTKNEDAV